LFYGSCIYKVVVFTTTCAISAYYLKSYRFESHSRWGVLDTVCQWLATTTIKPYDHDHDSPMDFKCVINSNISHKFYINKGNAERDISPRLKIWPSHLDLWPWKSIGFQILLGSHLYRNYYYFNFAIFFKHLHWTVLIQFLLQCKSLELGPMVIYILPTASKVQCFVPVYIYNHGAKF
jgi:hypothetical protein